MFQAIVRVSCSILLCVLCWAAAAADPAPSVNVDELPHTTLVLPNGSRADVIQYNGRNYRLVESSILAGTDASDPDVCFEAKFDSTTLPDRVRLFGQQATIICEDRARFKQFSEMKRGDNAWFCGTIRKSKDGKSLEYFVNDILKLPEDLERYNARIGHLEKKKDAEGLIELGHRIERERKSATNIDADFSKFEKLGALRDKAFDSGLALKEQTLRADDADGMFAIALQWKELRRRNPKFREWVSKCLEVDPEHPNASRVAEDQLGLVKFEKRWLTKDAIDRILAERKADQERLDAAQKAALEAKAKERERAVRDRPALLTTYQLALCTSDPSAREGALKSMGEAIQKTVDPGFGAEAVDILVNLDDPAAVFPGLDLASRSPLGEVRTQVYEALVWRGGQSEKKGQTALEVLANALKAEKEAAPAKAGVEALVSMGGKKAVGTLIASLNTPEKGIRDEVIEGLKIAAKQPLTTREAWEDWWKKNQETFDKN